MGTFFLFRVGDRVACSFCEQSEQSLPKTLKFGQKEYFQTEPIPIFDHLLTADQKLAGFCLHPLDSVPTLKRSRMLTATNAFDDASDWDVFSVVLTGNSLGEVHNDCCACIAADVYFDGCDDHIIAIPDAWSHHWTGLAFTPMSGDIPKPAK